MTEKSVSLYNFTYTFRVEEFKWKLFRNHKPPKKIMIIIIDGVAVAVVVVIRTY